MSDMPATATTIGGIVTTKGEIVMTIGEVVMTIGGVVTTIGEVVMTIGETVMTIEKIAAAAVPPAEARRGHRETAAEAATRPRQQFDGSPLCRWSSLCFTM